MRAHSIKFGPALALAPFLLLAGCGEPAPAPVPTVVLISIDTLRADRLGVYGNAPDVSPNLDALARDAVVFDDARTVAPWTLPSHASMLTGLDAVAHGVEGPSDRIPAKAVTVAEQFAAHGYRTAAWTAGGFVDKGWGLEDGFESYDTNNPWKSEGTGFSRYLPSAIEWMQATNGAPFFAFLHSFDVHAPYTVARPESLERFRARGAKDSERDHQFFRATYTGYAKSMGFERYQRLEEALNDYDAGVHDADLAVGELIAALKSMGRYDDALIVVVSDHGESFYDHGLWMGHGIHMYDGVMRVPLLVKLPHSQLAGRRVDTLVDLVDIAPTLLEAAGLPPTPHLQGTSLAAIARGQKRSRSWSLSGAHSTATHALVRGPYKYIGESAIPPVHSVRHNIHPEIPTPLKPFVQGDAFKTMDHSGQPYTSYYPNRDDPLGYFEDVTFLECLFDHRNDPGELHNLAKSEPGVTAQMREALRSVYAESKRIHAELAGDEPQRRLTQAEARQLRELGYTVGLEDQPVAPDIDAQLAELRAHPPQPPPQEERLIELDRAVHRLRLKRRDTGSLAAEDLEELARLAERVAEWLEATSDSRWSMRAMWRVLEIEALGTTTNPEFSTSASERRVRAFHRKHAVGAGNKAAEDDVEGEDPSRSSPWETPKVPPPSRSGG